MFRRLVQRLRAARSSGDGPLPVPYMQANPAYARHEIGAFTYGRPTVLSWRADDRLIIGRFCSIADGATFVLSGGHRHDWITTYPFSEVFEEYRGVRGHPSSKGPIIIGNDVWVGMGATILSGVTVGDGAVIGAGAVVSRNVRPYAIVAGNPAVERKRRFPDEVVGRLLELRWWDWPVSVIRSRAELLMSQDVDALLAMAAREEQVPAPTGGPP